MEKYSIDDFTKVKSPEPGTRYKDEFLTTEKNTENIGGLFTVLSPGMELPYHFHQKRESILIVVSGEATEIVEGKEVPIKTNDILFIPPGEKHTTANRSDKDFCYLEFFTYPPSRGDFIEVK